MTTHRPSRVAAARLKVRLAKRSEATVPDWIQELANQPLTARPREVVKRDDPVEKLPPHQLMLVEPSSVAAVTLGSGSSTLVKLLFRLVAKSVRKHRV
jgi:hypothetical protein